jgi:type II secretory pathway pseudopilin PulG
MTLLTAKNNENNPFLTPLFQKGDKKQGYMLIMLMVVVLVLSIGLMVAMPVWQSQIQREKEEELIFRGKQYMEAIRLYQLKNPGSFPKDFEELIKEKYLRRLFKDPMTKNGEWNIILATGGIAPSESEPAPGSEPGPGQGQGAPQKVLIAPQSALSSIDNPMILGVVSSSKQKSFKIYFGKNTYDKWLFYYGQDPNKTPQISYYGESEKKEKE